MTNYVTENNKYVLMTGDATNPLFEKFTHNPHPEELGELYVISRKKTYIPVAVATVTKNGFSIYTENEKTDISSADEVKFEPSAILVAFTA